MRGKVADRNPWFPSGDKEKAEHGRVREVFFFMEQFAKAYF